MVKCDNLLDCLKQAVDKEFSDKFSKIANYTDALWFYYYAGQYNWLDNKARYLEIYEEIASLYLELSQLHKQRNSFNGYSDYKKSAFDWYSSLQNWYDKDSDKFKQINSIVASLVNQTRLFVFQQSLQTYGSVNDVLVLKLAITDAPIEQIELCCQNKNNINEVINCLKEKNYYAVISSDQKFDSNDSSIVYPGYVVKNLNNLFFDKNGTNSFQVQNIYWMDNVFNIYQINNIYLANTLNGTTKQFNEKNRLEDISVNDNNCFFYEKNDNNPVLIGKIIDFISKEDGSINLPNQFKIYCKNFVFNLKNDNSIKNINKFLINAFFKINFNYAMINSLEENMPSSISFCTYGCNINPIIQNRFTYVGNGFIQDINKLNQDIDMVKKELGLLLPNNNIKIDLLKLISEYKIIFTLS